MADTSRRDFLRASLGAGALAWLGTQVRRAGAAGRPPNLVLLFADDLGWTDLGCYGSGYYETPNLDRLCSQGLKFTDAYAPAANCAPSRACLLSGQYVPRHGIYTVGGKLRFDQDKRLLKWDERKLLAPENPGELQPEKVTFAEALKAAGYATGMFGKWHLGHDEEHDPHAQGFDETVLAGMAHHLGYRCQPMPNPPPGPEDYLSDHLADCALDFIERHQQSPFLLYLPDYLVHVPLEAKRELLAKYEAKQPVGGHHNPTYAAMIESLDHSFGRVVDKLDALGLSENTLVVFFSDNGGVGSAQNRGLDDNPKSITSNRPLRGMKGMLYEGGIRVPMIARWPGVIEPGTVTAEPVHGVDLYPTFLAAAGATKPDQPLDGESLLPLLQGKQEHTRRQDLYWFMPGYLPGRQAPANALRSGDWKLLEFFEDGHLELFNLRDDIGERHDLAAELPDKAAELHARMKAWRAEIGAEIPPRNPNFEPANEGKW